jgi:hypothetical protein
MVTKKRELYLIFSIIFLLLISLTSANAFGDWINRITGNPIGPQPQNVSVVVVGINPVAIGVTVPAQTPIENSMITVNFFPIVSDKDGVNDIDDLSVNALVSGSTIKNTVCNLVGDLNLTAANYSCSINMYYWETAGTWNVRVQAKDFGNGTMINYTTTFDYNLLNALVISPPSLTWSPLVPLSTNQNSTEPTTINNTGNYAGTMAVNGIDLKGEIVNTEAIPVASFRVGQSELQCSGTTLVNGTSVNTVIPINPGNLSAGGGIGQTFIYYCIPDVPQVSSQTYSALGARSWSIGYW